MFSENSSELDNELSRNSSLTEGGSNDNNNKGTLFFNFMLAKYKTFILMPNWLNNISPILELQTFLILDQYWRVVGSMLAW